MNKKIVIFDMDGVIFDSVKESMKTVMYQYPGLTEEGYKELLTGNFHEEVQKIYNLKRTETEEEEKNRKEEYTRIKSKSSVFPGIKELLLELKLSGFILIINTSAYNRNTLPMLENTGVLDLFDLIATAELSKIKKEKFKIIKEKYNVDTRDIIFVTDTLGDLREAEESEVYTISVMWGAHDETYFKREKHPLLFDIVYSVNELKKSIIKYFEKQHD